MAILKHKTNKNPNYGDALDYLLFQHDEYTLKPILDEQGRKQLREEYYIDGINCDPMFFDKECEMLNKKYNKNQKYDEIKSHHYILSFDPSDKIERGLTGEKAQLLGLEFAQKNFPGHQMLVVTHTDGHNHTGNIHVHIVLNSLRKYDVPEQDFMERSCDHKAGYKHHQTRALLTHMQESLMKICEREGLHQIDLLSPSVAKVTEAEYWAGRRGQEKLNQINEKIIADGFTPTKTKFETQKQKLRNAIEDIAPNSQSFPNFQELLFEKYQITVMDKRGRYSYHLPDREKNISERSLGTHYGKEYLESVFQNMSKDVENDSKTSEQQYDPSYDYRTDPIAILFIRSNLRLVVDLQKCVKAQQSRAYAQKVKLSNLKQMAETIVYVQEHGYDTTADIHKEHTDISEKRENTKAALSAVSAELKTTNMQIHYLGGYLSNKRMYNQFQKSRNKKIFRKSHEKEIVAYEKSRSWLQEQFPDSSFPDIQELRQKKENLEQRKNALQKNFDYYKNYEIDLRTISANVDSILDTTVPEQRKEREEVLT